MAPSRFSDGLEHPPAPNQLKAAGRVGEPVDATLYGSTLRRERPRDIALA